MAAATITFASITFSVALLIMQQGSAQFSPRVIPGLTRDRHYGVCRPEGQRTFAVVDTGGIAGESEHLVEGLLGATARQARAAAAEADLVLFIVDGREGASALDDESLAWLRTTARPTLLVINKTDGIDTQAALNDFARYGFSEAVAVSSAHRQGIDELIDEVIERLPEEGTSNELDDQCRQVDSGQSAAGRGADDRVRRARHHA